jgi:hypothetical protein
MLESIVEADEVVKECVQKENEEDLKAYLYAEAQPW